MTRGSASSERRRRLLVLGVCVFVPLALGWLVFLQPHLIRTHVVQAFKIPSGAMMPTLLVGDHVLADKRVSAEDVKRFDVIVFQYPPDPSKVFVKRVVGLPGDSIEVQDKGLFVNGDRIAESYVIHQDAEVRPERDQYGPVVIPEGALFVMGDNRDRSYDSRFWGVVAFEQVLGRLELIYWSWDRDELSVRWDRVGSTVR